MVIYLEIKCTLFFLDFISFFNKIPHFYLQFVKKYDPTYGEFASGNPASVFWLKLPHRITIC